MQWAGSRRRRRAIIATLAQPVFVELVRASLSVPRAAPANLLAAPAVAPATLAGVACALLAVVSPTLAAAPAQVAGLAAGWLAVVARTLSALPGAGLHGPSGLAGVALVTGLGGVGWFVVRRLRRRRLRAMLDTCPP